VEASDGAGERKAEAASLRRSSFFQAPLLFTSATTFSAVARWDRI